MKSLPSRIILNSVVYVKIKQTERYGWYALYTSNNFKAGVDYLTPSGDASRLNNLNVDKVTNGVLKVENGGTGTDGLTGIIKGNGINPYSIAQAGVDYLEPDPFVSMVAYFAGVTAPNGWLVADGSAVSRTTFARLFNRIGVTYGSGDGSTTFNLPNLLDRFAEGSTTVGTYKDAGIPNLKGNCYVTGNVGGTSATGPFYFDGGQAGEVPDDYRFNIPYLKFDASRVNPVYSDSANTVQPASLTLLPCIKY